MHHFSTIWYICFSTEWPNCFIFFQCKFHSSLSICMCSLFFVRFYQKKKKWKSRMDLFICSFYGEFKNATKNILWNQSFKIFLFAVADSCMRPKNSFELSLFLWALWRLWLPFFFLCRWIAVMQIALTNPWFAVLEILFLISWIRPETGIAGGFFFFGKH